VPGAVSRVAGRGELNILQPAFTSFRHFDVNAESIDLRSIAPTPPSPESDQIETIDVSLLIEGSFHQTEAFLARLENLKRLVEVTSVAIAPGESAERFTLASTLTLTMYVFREAA
jgi:Tfp pilus assembly protein PilO